jgi:hypothetical protein
MRSVSQALWPTLRVSALLPVAATCVLLSVGVTCVAVWRDGDLPLLLLSRVSVLAMACSVAGALDDDAAGLADAFPVARFWQRGLRALPALVLLAAGWGTFVVAVSAALPSGYGALPWGGLTMELASCTAVAVAAAAWQVRRSGTGGAPAGAAALFGLAGMWFVPVLPERWTLLTTPGVPDWAAAHGRWAALAAIAALLAAWWSRDPSSHPRGFAAAPSRPARTSPPGSAGPGHPGSTDMF